VPGRGVDDETSSLSIIYSILPSNANDIGSWLFMQGHKFMVLHAGLPLLLTDADMRWF
jgi:hypothetical protein